MRAKSIVAVVLIGALAVTATAFAAGRFNPSVSNTVAARVQDGEQPTGPARQFVRQTLRKLIGLRAQLGITDEQREEIRAVVLEYKDDLVPAIKEVVLRRQALREAVLADEADPETIRAAAEEVGYALGEAGVVISDIAAEVRPILTEDQQYILLEFRTERQEALMNMLDEATAE